MATIQVKARHVDSDYAERQVTLREGGEHEIDDDVAVTIASWWQSPGSVGSALAALASGAPVEYEELADDIYRTRPEASTPLDRLTLGMLSTWALRRTEADTQNYVRNYRA